MIIYCSDLKKADNSLMCCSSCHEDAELGYYSGEMVYLYDSKNLTVETCCRIANDLDPPDVSNLHKQLTTETRQLIAKAFWIKRKNW